MGTVMHWWAVGCDGSVPHFYEAPNGRNAVAQFRANLIEMERGSGVSLKDARIIVRGLEPQVLEGPLTAEEAYELDVAWSYLMLTHTGGISRKEAVERIGEDRVARLERSARKRYGLLASGPE
jgi:hypothetical protein